MGTYHIVVNETRKEYIEPGEVNDSAIKEGFVLGVVANLSLWMMLSHDHWRGDTVIIVDDSRDRFDTICNEYKNVTENAIDDFNHWVNDPEFVLKYTPDVYPE